MAVKVVQLEDFEQELKDFGKRTLKEQQEAVARGLLKSIPDLVEASPVDTGEYASSWDFTINEREAILGNFAPHAAVIERGARPFTPPIGPLLDWAKRVLNSSSQPPHYDSEVWALAKGTQKKISESGMMPRNVLEKTLPKIIRNIKEEMDKIE